MNRSVLWMRRTLQCAVFACPVALLSSSLSALLQLIWSLFYILPTPIAAPIWKKRQDAPAALMLRILFSCSAALAISRLPALLILLLFPNIHFLSLMLVRFLTASSGILLQSYLIGILPRDQQKAPLSICIFLMIFIFCTLSGA